MLAQYKTSNFINKKQYQKNMDKVFIEARYKGEIDLSRLDTGRLPESVALFSSVQYLDYLPEIMRYLIRHNINVKMFRTNATYKGQLLGCSNMVFSAEAFLYVGDGRFHPLALAVYNDKPVWQFNPRSGVLKQMKEEDITRFKMIRKSAIAKFHSSEKVGILVSLKPGQNKMKLTGLLKEKYPEKRFYTFIADTINFDGLEDFNFIDCFVNSACERISYDDTIRLPKKIVDIRDVL